MIRTDYEDLMAWLDHVYANFPYEQRRIACAMTAILDQRPNRDYVTLLEIQGEMSREHHERTKPTIRKHLRDLAKLGLVEVLHDAYPVLYGPLHDRDEPDLSYKTRGISMNTVLHKDDKNNFAIVTTAESEEAFRGQFAAALDEMIREARFENDWPFHLNGWIEQASEVICRFRGYKSQVVERRTIIAGVLDPDQAAIEVGYQSPVA